MEKISLSDGEWNIMNALWKESPRTITQLTAELKESTGWSKHTVISMLGRLEKKKAVSYEEGERAKQYYPSVEQEEAVLCETKGFLDRVYEGSLGLMLNTMVEKKELSRQEIDELYSILKRAEEDGENA